MARGSDEMQNIGWGEEEGGPVVLARRLTSLPFAYYSIPCLESGIPILGTLESILAIENQENLGYGTFLWPKPPSQHSTPESHLMESEPWTEDSKHKNASLQRNPKASPQCISPMQVSNGNPQRKSHIQAQCQSLMPIPNPHKTSPIYIVIWVRAASPIHLATSQKPQRCRKDSRVKMRMWTPWPHSHNLPSKS